jgi:hypothetical protein
MERGDSEGPNREPPEVFISGGFLLCAPGRAHSLGGESPLRTLMTGTVS